MKIVDSLINSLIYTAYVLGACVCAAAVDILTLKMLNEFLVISLYTQTVIRVVIYSIATLAVLAVVAYKEGYKEAKFNTTESIVSCAFALIFTFLFSLLFRFNRFVAGGVKYISSLIAYGEKILSEEQITDVGYRYAIPVFVGLFVLYSLTIVLFKYLGKNVRIKDRATLKNAQEE